MTFSSSGSGSLTVEILEQTRRMYGFSSSAGMRSASVTKYGEV
jgi:hypothetical protein